MLFIHIHSKPVDIQDTTVTDVGDSSTSEDVTSKQEQPRDTGYMSMLEIIDDLKQSTDRYTYNTIKLYFFYLFLQK